MQAIVQAVDIADAVEICEQWIRHPGNGCKFSIDFVSSNDIKLTESEKSWHRRSNDRVKQV